MNTNVDAHWASSELSRAGHDLTSKTAQTVMYLIANLNELTHLDQPTLLASVSIFAKLASGHAIAPRDVAGVDSRWEQFLLGDHPAGVTVRVKADAYSGSAGQMHNGMVGKLVAGSGGYAVVQYSGESDGTGQRHRPDVLEVLVKL